VGILFSSLDGYSDLIIIFYFCYAGHVSIVPCVVLIYVVGRRLMLRCILGVVDILGTLLLIAAVCLV